MGSLRTRGLPKLWMVFFFFEGPTLTVPTRGLRACPALMSRATRKRAWRVGGSPTGAAQSHSRDYWGSSLLAGQSLHWDCRVSAFVIRECLLAQLCVAQTILTKAAQPELMKNTALFMNSSKINEWWESQSVETTT